MDFAYDAEDEAFRAELQAWLDANLPEFAEQGEIGDDHVEGFRRTMARRQAWQKRLNEGKWAAINWPIEWGGREATTMQNVIYSETMARAKAPGIYNPNGIWQIGPMIIRWGTDEQKQMWLPGILDATVHWCQGFSEPEAGSDLANLRTTAVREGDGWNVAMGTLTHERAGTGSIAIGLRSELDAMIKAAREVNPGALDSPDIRERIARMYTQVELTRLLNARALSKVLKGERSFP